MKPWPSFIDDALWTFIEHCPWITEATHDVLMAEWLLYKQTRIPALRMSDDDNPFEGGFTIGGGNDDTSVS